jgi:hypothetical protein
MAAAGSFTIEEQVTRTANAKQAALLGVRQVTVVRGDARAAHFAAFPRAQPRIRRFEKAPQRQGR